MTMTRSLIPMTSGNSLLASNTAPPLLVMVLEERLIEPVLPCSSQMAAPPRGRIMDRFGVELANSRRWPDWQPGSEFKVVDALFTNFHQPKSSLVVMLSAFVGDKDLLFKTYAEAVKEKYRFFSYGDCMLVIE